MKRTRRTEIPRLLALILVAVVVVGAMAIQAPAQARENGVYSKTTRHTLTEPFWGYWVTHDGPSRFGLPVSEPIKSEDEQVQYFEFGVLTTKEEEVERINAGELLMKQLESRSPTAESPSADQPGATPSAVDSQVSLDSKPPAKLVTLIKSYVSENGGRERFGKSLSAAYVDGESVIRWYTYARVEVTGLTKPEVTLAPVGLELAQALDVKMDRVNRGGLQTLDLERPGAHYFVGDGTVPEAAGEFEPAGIIIPSIGMDAAIEDIDIVEGVMGVPEDPWKVGWYQQLSAPGLNGNAVMAGHVDWWGIGPTVFYNLSGIQMGAAVYVVDENGAGATYLVSTIDEVAADTNAADIVGATDIPTLTLITCTGTFDGAHYTSRLIVKATRI